MKNKIQDLRNHLFECIELVKAGEMEVDDAKVIARLSQVIVNSAKVEVDFMRVNREAATEKKSFFKEPDASTALLEKNP